MWDVKKIILLIALFNALSTTEAQTYITCNGQNGFTAAGQSLAIYFSAANTPYTCTYLVKAPVGTYISATVYHTLSGSEPTCSGDRLYISRDGDYNFNGASFFCGNRASTPFQINSIGNELTIAVVPSTSTAVVRIDLRSIALTQSNCDCSWSVRSKIVSGTNTAPNEFIGHVDFVEKSGDFRESIAGGTIISQNYVVTAAHVIMAIQNVYGWNIEMKVGRYDITITPETSDTIYAATYQIANAYVHNGYDSETNANDIALVQSQGYIKFNRGVGPACLSFAYMGYTVNDGTGVTAVGHGSTEYALSAANDPTSWILQKVTLYVNKNLGNCASDTSKICAKGLQNPSTGLYGDSCQRDSGSGLYAAYSGRQFLIGVTSDGEACGSSSSYSVNMYIPSYINWITSTLPSEFFCSK